MIGSRLIAIFGLGHARFKLGGFGRKSFDQFQIALSLRPENVFKNKLE